MTFNHFAFYGFLAFVLLVHYLLPARGRWAWLLACSYVFYAFLDVRFVAVLLGGTLIAYVCGRLIKSSADERDRHGWMLAGAGVSLALLFGFRYISFFNGILGSVAAALGLRWTLPAPAWFYPLGISFFTLQALSYIWDVFDGRVEAEHHFGHFALYMAFFPKLLSGPLERPAPFLQQIRQPQAFPYAKLDESLLRIGAGLLKKLVIADRLAAVADAVFAAPADFPAPKLLAGVLAFAFQVYIDFSAYTDIALGSAALLGFELSENFERPYFSASVTEFWRRWHITFSSWLRDYVFLPLETRDRRKKPRALWLSLHILITFLASGLWHGANWTFIAWGGLHGLYQAVEQLTSKTRQRLEKHLPRAIFVIGTFILISIAWVFFRADSLAAAGQVLSGIFTWRGGTQAGAWSLLDESLGLDAPDFILMAAALAIFFIVEWWQAGKVLLTAFKRLPLGLRWLLYYGLFFAITIFGFYGEVSGADFVYLKF